MSHDFRPCLLGEAELSRCSLPGRPCLCHNLCSCYCPGLSPLSRSKLHKVCIFPAAFPVSLPNSVLCLSLRSWHFPQIPDPNHFCSHAGAPAMWPYPRPGLQQLPVRRWCPCIDLQLRPLSCTPDPVILLLTWHLCFWQTCTSSTATLLDCRYHPLKPDCTRDLFPHPLHQVSYWFLNICVSLPTTVRAQALLPSPQICCEHRSASLYYLPSSLHCASCSYTWPLLTMDSGPLELPNPMTFILVLVRTVVVPKNRNDSNWLDW